MQSKYSVTFARRGLLHHESLQLAGLYLELHDWSEVRRVALAANLLQARMLSTSKKLCSEAISRLKLLSDQELEFFLSGDKQEQCYLLWLAVCKRYRFIHEFAVEVLHEKFLNVDLSINTADYDRFFNTKAEWHEELARLSTETHKKVRQTVFLLLREAQLLDKRNHIIPALCSNRFLKVVSKDSNAYITIFPVPDLHSRAIAK